jgi:hypothetical protein
VTVPSTQPLLAALTVVVGQKTPLTMRHRMMMAIICVFIGPIPSGLPTNIIISRNKNISLIDLKLF